MIPEGLRYSEDHEWVRVEPGNVGVVGITEYAADQLGDVVFLDLPGVDAKVSQFEKFGEVESVKAVSDIVSPITGSVIERNEAAIDSPELVNESPYEAGWMVKVRLSATAELEKLMSAEQYRSFLSSQEH